MSLPIPGELEVKFNRVYIVVNPNVAQGPPTYRVSNPDEIDGGGGVVYDFDGVNPINVDIIPGVGTNPSIVKTSMDIQDLEDRVN